MHTNRKTILIVLTTLAIGLLLGWFLFGGSEAKVTEEHQHEHGAEEIAGETTWTCSMHPQIRQPEPGDCPICGMDLIPLEEEQNGEVDPNAVSMSATAMQLANIKTTIVGAVEPLKVVRLNGKVQEDERLIFSQSSHIPGRIEDLLVNFTGDYVQKGQVIASVYSPDLVTAQEELFEAQKIKDSQPQLFEAAKAKLKNWKLTDEQISQILSSGTAQQTFDVRAEVSGYVTQKKVNTGDYVRRGQAIYEIADLSKVWILFDVYESDLTWINKGDKVSYTIESLPGETFEGTIDYLDPVINPKTRVAKARVVQSNKGLKLKPEMFVSGKVEAKLPQTDALVVPKTAVMWTGVRSVVYVKSETGQGVYFNMREVDLGPALGESYVVENGVQQGEEIAVNGTFSIDAAAQLAGKASMMSLSNKNIEQEHTMFKVGGECEMCKDRIEAAALSVSGVVSAEWDAETKELHLNYEDGLSLEKVHHAIAEVGHDTELEKAPDSVYEELPECCLYDRFEYQNSAKKETAKAEHVMIKVRGNCGMCKDRIEEASLSVAGVESANWDSETETLHLNFDASKTSSDEVQKAIAAVGHDTEKYKAPDAIYEALPECCLYR
ncbi:efflux RND transporter periplasmic adaptor subunit [uncultured Draconibacterium sp.]|uniref:efflux RND transporter periplasmic adaptor subunit n=1 Tax=uncultured Draconibacterium sp. TaxID=1573823 RepID=UPI002AA66D7A|nr:efflux RND transporter periplasmic adaptor subunit [uncultured Draconibacterium sp.]